MKTMLSVKGMMCKNCVKHVTEALEGVPGVKKAKVNLKKGSALVDHEDATTVDSLTAAVTAAGYEAAAAV
jgi:copper chaperone CopZ